MKLVKILLWKSDFSLYTDYIFWTEKPMSYFCSYDGEIKYTFVNWLKENENTIYDEVTSGYFNVEVRYYDEQTLKHI